MDTNPPRSRPRILSFEYVAPKQGEGGTQAAKPEIVATAFGDKSDPK
jgi:hypothetical protein